MTTVAEIGVGELTPERLTVMLLKEVSRKSDDISSVVDLKAPKIKRNRTSKKAPAANMSPVDNSNSRISNNNDNVLLLSSEPVKKKAVKKTRDPSEYNKFVRAYCFTHKGEFKTSVEELRELTEDKMTAEQLKVYKAEKMMYRKQVFGKELGHAWSAYKKEHLKGNVKRVTDFKEFCELYPNDEVAQRAWYVEGPGIAYPKLVVSMFPLVERYCIDAIVKLLAGDARGAQAVQERHEQAATSDVASAVCTPGSTEMVFDTSGGDVAAFAAVVGTSPKKTGGGRYSEVPIAVVNSKGEEKMLGKANLIIMLVAQQWGRILTAFYEKYPKCGKYEKGIPCYTINAANKLILESDGGGGGDSEKSN